MLNPRTRRSTLHNKRLLSGKRLGVYPSRSHFLHYWKVGQMVTYPKAWKWTSVGRRLSVRLYHLPFNRLTHGMLVIRWAQLSMSQCLPEMSNNEFPDPQVAANLSQWSTDTNEIFLRIIVACLIGSLSRVRHSGVWIMLWQKRSRFTREWCSPRILCSDSLIGSCLGRRFAPTRCLVYANNSSEESTF